MRESVGLIETTNFTKFEICGPGARGCLSDILANIIPVTGRLALAPMLNDKGKLAGDFTVAALDPERFMLVGSGVAERYYERYFDAHLRDDGSVSVRTMGPELAGLSIAGPKSRDVLQDLVRDDMVTNAFPFMHIREMCVGMITALVGRISYTGDIGTSSGFRPDIRRLYLICCARPMRGMGWVFSGCARSTRFVWEEFRRLGLGVSLDLRPV